MCLNYDGKKYLRMSSYFLEKDNVRFQKYKVTTILIVKLAQLQLVIFQTIVR